MTTLEDDRHQQRLEEIGREAERWMAHHAEAFAALPRGTTVVINVETGEFVTAADWHAAQESFDLRFGPDVPSFTFTKGEPIFVGGGVWLR